MNIEEFYENDLFLRKFLSQLFDGSISLAAKLQIQEMFLEDIMEWINRTGYISKAYQYKGIQKKHAEKYGEEIVDENQIRMV